MLRGEGCIVFKFLYASKFIIYEISLFILWIDKMLNYSKSMVFNVFTLRVLTALYTHICDIVFEKRILPIFGASCFMTVA